MTAIVGLNYLDGILMLADTEESLDAYAKSECDKLYRFVSKTGTLVLGGSGDSHLIACAEQDLYKLFKSQEAIPAPQVADALDIFAKEFFDETIAPLARAGVDASMQMLIGVHCYGDGTGLFHWAHNRVVEIDKSNSVSIGFGIRQTHPMLRDVQACGSKECMLLHGLRIMYHTKRTVSGVGGKTEALALQSDGSIHYFGTDTTQKIEDLIAHYEHFLRTSVEGNVFTLVASQPEIEEQLQNNIDRNIDQLPSDLRNFREQYRHILKEQLPKGRSSR